MYPSTCEVLHRGCRKREKKGDSSILLKGSKKTNNQLLGYHITRTGLCSWLTFVVVNGLGDQEETEDARAVCHSVGKEQLCPNVDKEAALEEPAMNQDSFSEFPVDKAMGSPIFSNPRETCNSPVADASSVPGATPASSLSFS